MRTCFRSLVLALTVALSIPVFAARADVLTIGDMAPPIVVGSYVKGSANVAATGKIYVVEFWATWCVPCKEAIPHLTATAKKYPDVNFLGVSVLENSQSLVKPFVDSMGATMDYTVAMDSIPAGGAGADGVMEKTWMLAAAQYGIPTSFLIGRDGRIEWIGHPLGIDDPLRQVTAGTWDRAAARAQIRPGQVTEAHLQAASAEIATATKSGHPDQVIAAVERASLADPSVEPHLGEQKFQALRALGKADEALAYGDRLIGLLVKNGDHAYDLNSFAWDIVDPLATIKPDARFCSLALKAARTVDEIFHNKDAVIADTLAETLFVTGDATGAIAAERRAIRLSKGTEFEQDPDFQKHLDRYSKFVVSGATAAQH